MLARGSILVVDREPTIVDLLVEILTDEGYAVHAARDTAGALAAIARSAPALILLDVGYLGLRGAGLLEPVRAASPAAMPIVVMTTAPRAAVPLLVPGTIECLAKPFDLDALLDCVARYVQPTQEANQLLACYTT
jgi:DNA-binding NtrC family response regulator